MSLIDAKLLWRDWRGGQLNLIVSALILAVAVVTAVSLLADRVEQGLNARISSFLAADLAVRGGIEIDKVYRTKASEFGLDTSDITEFASMVFVGELNHLASVKVVDDNYPLRGELELADNTNAAKVSKVVNGPEKGEVWVEPRLLNLLEANIGDQVEVGYSKLTIRALIVNEPDRGTGFSAMGARVIMNDQDLAESKLIRPGSRVRYKLLMRGDEQAIRDYQTWYKKQHRSNSEDLGAQHYRLLTPENSEQRLAEAMQRGRTFLLLSGTIGVLLAGLAMALASHRYARRLTDQVALMKAWGQSSQSIRRSQFVRLSLIAIIATTIGLFCGWLAHFLLLQVVDGLFSARLPLPTWRPWIVASITGVVCVIGFALPALWHLPAIAPLKVLRRDLPDSLLSKGKQLWIGIAALLALAYWYSGSLVITLLFFTALFILFAVCAVVALQILKMVRGLGSWRGSYVRLGLANLWRRRAQTMVQLVGFSTTLMLLLVVIGMRTSLISEWQAQLPDDTPSHFVFNVAATDVDSVKSLFKDDGLQTTDWYPMVRGRLVSINGETISPQRFNQADGLRREVNFTQTATLPYKNEVVAGEWWDEDSQRDEFSMEQEVADELGVSLGDEFTFSIGGLKFSAVLTSIRSLDWQTMTPNFYLIFRPGMLDKYSPNWMTSVRAGNLGDSQSVIPKQAPFVSKMVRAFPTAVVLELNNIIERIRGVIQRVTQGLEMILLLVLACGALVLFAAISVSYDERLRENAILRTLGSSRKIVVGALAVEYAALGAIAGFIAGAGNEIVLYFLQTMVFKIEASWHPQLWLLGLVSGVVLITVLGLLRSREIIAVPPLQSLRQIV